jgi:hypothetical protein
MPYRVVSITRYIVWTWSILLLFALLFIVPFAATTVYHLDAGPWAAVVTIAGLVFVLGFGVSASRRGRRYETMRQAAARQDDRLTRVLPVRPATTEIAPLPIAASVSHPFWQIALSFITFPFLLIIAAFFALSFIPSAVSSNLPSQQTVLIIVGIFAVAFGFALLRQIFALNRTVYRVTAGEEGLTVGRRWSRRTIPWREIRMIYDVGASHVLRQLNEPGGLLRPYLYNDPLLYNAYLSGHVLRCIEVASERTRVVVFMLSEHMNIDGVLSLGTGTSRSMGVMRGMGVARFLFALDDRATYATRMAAILQAIVDRSGVAPRAAITRD